MTDHNPERIRNITLSFSEKIAHNLDLEAQIEGVSVAELFRRATAAYILSKSVVREINALYPETNTVDVRECYIAIDEDQKTVDLYGLNIHGSDRPQIELIQKFKL